MEGSSRFKLYTYALHILLSMSMAVQIQGH